MPIKYYFKQTGPSVHKELDGPGLPHLTTLVRGLNEGNLAYYTATKNTTSRKAPKKQQPKRSGLPFCRL